MNMNQHVSIDTALTTEASEHKVENHTFALWTLIILVAFAVLVLRLDASFTPNQRIEMLLQSGMYP